MIYPDPSMYKDWQTYGRALSRALEGERQKEVGKYSPFTPFIEGATAPGNISFLTQKGIFKLEFGQLIFSLILTWNAIPGFPVGMLRIGGFPLPVVNEPDIWHEANIAWSDLMLSPGYTQLSASFPPGQNYCLLRESGPSLPLQPLDESALQASGALFITGSFTTYTAGLTG